MMKKVLSLFVVMCIIIGTLPAIALAEANDLPGVSIWYIAEGAGDGAYSYSNLFQGGDTLCYKEGSDGALVETTAADYTVKLEYLANEVATLYLKGANVARTPIIIEPYNGAGDGEKDAPVNIVVEEDSTIVGEQFWYGAISVDTYGEVTISSVDGAKLTVTGADSSGDSCNGTITARGDMVIKDAVLDITVAECNTGTPSCGIFTEGTLTIESSEIEINVLEGDGMIFNKAPTFVGELGVIAATTADPAEADLVAYDADAVTSYKYAKIAPAANDDEGGEVEPGLLEEFLFEYWNGSGWGATTVNPGEPTVYFVQADAGSGYSYLTTEGADANNYVLKIEYPANEAVTVYFNGLNMVQPGGWGVLFESATNSADVNLVIEADSSYTLDGEGYYGGIECYTSKTFTISSVDGAKLTAAGQDTSADGLSGAATIWHRGNLVIDGAALEISADKGNAIGAVGTITIKDSDVVACSETMAAFNKAPIFGKGLDVVAATVQAPEDADLVEYVKDDAATYRYVKITVNEEEPEVPVEPAYKFSNTVTCNETLDLNFYLPKDAVPMAATWTVTYGGNVLEEGEYSLDLQSDGRMRVRVSYYPHQLNNEVTVICKDANGVVLAERSNSIQGYCMAYLGLTNGKALDRALMVAMLEYGSWAQIGVSSTDPLANRDLTAAHKAYLTDYAWPASGVPTVFAENNQTLDYTFSCSVTCNETLDLNFYLNANATDQAASWTVTIDGEEVSEGKYMISKDAKNRWRIRVSFLGNQMNSLVSVTCKDAEGNVIAQRSNSIREYAMLYLAQSSATTRDSALMVAMLEFGSLAQIGLGQTNVLANYLLDDTYRANLTHTHNYSSKVTAPTCTEKGYTTYTCSCGHTYTANPTAAKGHSYSEATCTKAATCACGAVNGTPLGHFYNYGICSRCDAADPNYNEPAPGEPGFVWKIATTTGDLVGYGDYDTDADAIRGLYDAGFRYIDFSMYSNLTLDSAYMSENWREEVLKLKAVADELGMTFVQAHSPGGNLLTTNQSEADELIAATKRSVEICEVLGIRNLVVHIGWRDGLTREQWMQQNKIMYNNFLPLAEKCGVNILCENSTVKNMGSFEYLSTGAEMREFVEYVDHPNFHACWDTGHANCDNLDQYQNIVDIGDELYAIHYAENDGSYDSHVMPFFGTVNHNDIMRALVEIGFRGPFVLECDGGSRTSNTYTGPAFDWIKEELNVTDPTNPSVLGRLNRAQQEKLLFDIANYIVTTYPTTAP